MEYITHTKYKGKDLVGNDTLIPRGKKLTRDEDVLFFGDVPICVYRSEVGKQHFSCNEDANGLLRGDLIRKIAYSDNRKNVNGWMQRFSEKQIEVLSSKKWNKFLEKNHEVIIFADCFFDAKISELQELYKELEGCEEESVQLLGNLNHVG